MHDSAKEPVADRRVRRAVLRYLLALGALAAAIGVTIAVIRVGGLRPHPAIGFSYLLAILASAWWGGYGPGLLCCFASFFLAPFLFLPNFNPANVDPSRFLLTLSVTLLVSRLASTRRQVEESLRASNAILEQRVAERTEALESANAQLQQAIQALERSNDDLRHFTYSASHDLQEPLRAILTFGQLLRERYALKLDEQGLTFLGFLTTGAQRMQELLEALRDYWRATEEDQGPPAPIDTEAVVALALEHLQTASQASGAVISKDQLPRVLAHEVGLLQIFQNLLSNSMKYKSDRPLQVHIGASQQGNQVTFAVQDNGIGFASEHQNRIFAPFQRLAGSDVAGHGMGLAICKKLVERSGGHIWAESIPGVGATFFFTLPLALHGTQPVTSDKPAAVGNRF